LSPCDLMNFVFDISSLYLVLIEKFFCLRGLPDPAGFSGGGFWAACLFSAGPS